MSANNVDLENNIDYTVNCIVSMNSSLTAESSTEFSVSWIETRYIPNAEISIDTDSFVANIKPYCEYYDYEYYEVEHNQTFGVYVKTNTK